MLNYNKINELLNNNSDTKQKFYRAIGVSQQGFKQTVENKTMKVETLERIAEYFKMPVAYFFDEIELINSPDVVPKEKYYELLEKYNNCLEEKDALNKSSEEPAPANKKSTKTVHK